MNRMKLESKSLLSASDVLKTLAMTTTGLTVMGTGGYLYSKEIEPAALSVSNVRVPIKNLSEAFEGYRIAQISDIHAGTWMNRERLMTVVHMVNQQNADLIAITGDYVTKGDVWKLADILIEPLSQLRAPDGVVTVLGNHDHQTDADAVREILKTANIHELENDSLVLERDSEKLAIAGVDDIYEIKADLNRLMERMPEDDVPAILLAHEPDFADLTAKSGRFALQMSGHSHGGQVRVPFLGAPILPPLGKKYPMGWYKVRDMIQYTNRGVGMIPPTVRLGCPPEITVFKLTCA